MLALFETERVIIKLFILFRSIPDLLLGLIFSKQCEVGLFFVFRFSLFVFRYSFFVFRFSFFVIRFSFFVIRFSIFVFGFSYFDIQNPILRFKLRPNIVFSHSKSYFDIRTGDEYRILTFKILY